MRPLLLLAITTLSPLLATEAQLTVAEPTSIAPAVARIPEPARWSWNQQPSAVTATGDRTWTPQPLAFVAGPVAHYIDFAGGSDDGDGTKAKPWKHHPWDPAASGAAKAASGVATWVFKRGVVYRGELRPHGAGTATEPIRLTSDPSWGSGEAVISGAEAVTGWTQGSTRADIPDGAKVWVADVDYLPRNLWSQAADGTLTRIPLARTPNWKVSDPEDVKSEWWSWENPEWWTNKHHIDFGGHRAHRGIDSVHLTQPAEYYVGATVRSEYGIVMGTPTPSRVEGFDPKLKAIIFQGIWFGDSEQIMSKMRYFLEDMPQYLDSDGEFWVEKKGDGGRIYLRLPGDQDPNQAHVEAARRINLIESGGLEHVVISGLTFTCTNTHWDLTQPGWGHPDVDNAAIRVQGSTVDLRIANCRFSQVAKAVLVKADGGGQTSDRIVLADNDIDHIDHGAITINCGRQGDVQVLRNRLHLVGERPYRQDHGHAVQIGFPQTMEVAGNLLDRCYGAGIFVFGGKGSGDPAEVPLARNLIYGNRVVDSLLSANDWGGIETWQGGPHYVFNNISGNAVGPWNWAYDPAKGGGRLGFAYYFDGSFKNAVFNNVAWGRSSDLTSPHCNAAAYYEATPTIENTFFNNTAYRFAMGSNWSPAGGRHLILGGLWADILDVEFQHGQLKEDKEAPPGGYEYSSIALSKNVFAGKPSKRFGVFESAGTGYDTLEAMRTAFLARKPLAGDIGERTDQPVMRDPEQHDFHPLPGSAAIDHGVKAFASWGLAKTVGEWQFRRNHSDPSVIADHHWYMMPYYISREHYYEMPTYPLTAVGTTEQSYVASPLEDWAEGALRFNGTDQFAAVSMAVMGKPVSYEANKQKRTAAGADLANPDIATGNLLIELVLQPDAGKSGSVLVAKLADSGYQLALNRAGSVTLTLKSGGHVAELAAGAVITNGAWHHVLAEVDRTAATAVIYIDGRKVAGGPMALAAGDSLANDADLLVAKGPHGNHFAGAISYLRICRATLAEARTSIDELYDWQFDGPFLRDFAGQPVTGKTRDAGAFEAAK